MARTKSNSNIRLISGLIALLLIAVGAVITFQTDFVGKAFSNNAPTLETAFIDSIKVSGTIKFEDLKLTGAEITKINNMARRNRTVFDRMDMNFELEDQFAPIDVDENTTLVMTLKLKADTTEVSFWSRKVPRSQLVIHLSRSIKKAASEYKHYRDMPNRTAPIKKLYI